MSVHSFRPTIRLALSTALTCGSLAVASPALAQDAAAETPDGQLDAIIVTANRREENLQDVPVSAATLSADAVQSVLAAGGEVTALAGRVPFTGRTPMEIEMVAMEFNGVFRHTPVRAAIGEQNLDFAPPPKGPTGVQTASVAGNAWSMLQLSKS